MPSRRAFATVREDVSMGMTLAIVGLCGAVALVVVPWALANRQRQDAATTAAAAGLAFSAADPFSCARVAFPLFRKGDGQVVENVMWREGAELASRVFDFAYYEVLPDDSGRDRRTYRRFSCAMVQVDGSWPDLSIGPDGLFEKALDLVGMGSIDVESDEFNRRFALRSPDRRFALALCDAAMIDFLIGGTNEIAFAIKGRWLLVTTDPVGPPLLPALLRLAEDFRARIPRVVYELYPSPFRDEHGRPLPAGDEALGVLDDEAAAGWFFGSGSRPGGAPGEVTGPEYDLDGNLVVPVEEDPWGEEPPDRPGGRRT